MNTDELKYFVESAKEENLSRAARTLGTTQSTLSHAIRRLEQEFDCKLFAKSGKNLKLTAHGKRFSERAAEILRNIQTLKDEVASGVTPLIGSVKAGGTLGSPVQILAQGLLRLKSSSNFTMEMTSLRSAEILKRVASKELDFGLCYDPQPYPHVKMRSVAVSETVVVVRRGHPLLKARGEKRFEILAKLPWARPKHLPGVSACTTHPIFSKLSALPKARFFYDSYDVAAEMLQATDGWALLPRAVLTKESSRLVAAIPAFVELTKLVLVWHEESDLGLVEHLTAELKATAPLHGWKISELV